MSKIIIKMLAFVAVMAAAEANEAIESLCKRSEGEINRVFNKFETVKTDLHQLMVDSQDASDVQVFEKLITDLEKLLMIKSKLSKSGFLMLTYTPNNFSDNIKIFDHFYCVNDSEDYPDALWLAQSINPGTAWNTWDSLSTVFINKDKIQSCRRMYRDALEDLLLDIIERPTRCLK